MLQSCQDRTLWYRSATGFSPGAYVQRRVRRVWLRSARFSSETSNPRFQHFRQLCHSSMGYSENEAPRPPRQRVAYPKLNNAPKRLARKNHAILCQVLVSSRAAVTSSQLYNFQMGGGPVITPAPGDRKGLPRPPRAPVRAAAAGPPRAGPRPAAVR